MFVRSSYICVYASLSLFTYFLWVWALPIVPLKGILTYMELAGCVCVCVCVYALWLFSCFVPASFVRAASTLTMKSFFSTSAASAGSGRAEQPAGYTSEEHDVGGSAAQVRTEK